MYPSWETIAHFWQNRHMQNLKGKKEVHLHENVSPYVLLPDKINKSNEEKEMILGRLFTILTFFTWTLKQKRSLTQTKFEVKKEFHC